MPNIIKKVVITGKNVNIDGVDVGRALDFSVSPAWNSMDQTPTPKLLRLDFWVDEVEIKKAEPAVTDPAREEENKN